MDCCRCVLYDDASATRTTLFVGARDAAETFAHRYVRYNDDWTHLYHTLWVNDHKSLRLAIKVA